jgi:isopentenyl phosphate kinase
VSELIVLKLGGSVITDKSSDTPRVCGAHLERLAAEIADAYESIKERTRLIVVHGAGSYGHPIVKRTGIDKGVTSAEQALAFAETQALQNELNGIVVRALLARGLPAMPLQPSAAAVMQDGRLVEMDLGAVRGLVSTGLVPVLFGVPAFDRSRGGAILSGDQIVAFLAVKLEAKLVIVGTDVDGVFTADPKTNPEATLIKQFTAEDLSLLQEVRDETARADVTGGMLGKVAELRVLAERGIETVVVNATKAGVVRRALVGEGGIATVMRR